MTIEEKSRYTVGSVSDILSLKNIDSDMTPEFDILEVRLDGIEEDDLAATFNLCLRFRSWGVPLLITLRDISEGGIHPLSYQQREQRILQFSEVASFLDVEIANFEAMDSTLKKAQQANVQLILSYHNFKETDSVDFLKNKYQQAIEYGADITKFALMHTSIDDISQCSAFMRSINTPLSMMGMGDLAPVSRVLYSQLGSVLNYGYLGNTATAPGQWSAAQLKAAIANTQFIE